MPNVNMAEPYFTEKDKKLIHKEIDCILDGALSMGPNVKLFEEEFAAMTGVRFAIAANSCTAALEVALAYYKIKENDEVIVPTETFVATGMAVHLSGARPVFADISQSTFCLGLDTIKEKMTSKTRGVILVHMGGYVTPEIEKIKEYCDKNNLFLIEDAAHAPGAKHNNKIAGSFGDVGCFSFYPTKVLTSGEGGMLTTTNPDIANFARSLQNRGRNMNSLDEEYILPGRNIRMTEVTALLGRVQLSHLSEYLNTRQKVAKIYRDRLKSDDRVKVVLPDNLESSSCWKIPVLLSNYIQRTDLTNNLKDKYGVTVDWAYQPAIHLQPIFRDLYGYKPGDLPVSEDLLSRHINLPCHQQMHEEDAHHVVDSMLKELDLLYQYESG